MHTPGQERFPTAESYLQHCIRCAELFDEHFGERAIEAAEGDVLGEFVKWCKLLIETEDVNDDSPEVLGDRTHAILEIRALLAKVE